LEFPSISPLVSLFQVSGKEKGPLGPFDFVHRRSDRLLPGRRRSKYEYEACEAPGHGVFSYERYQKAMYRFKAEPSTGCRGHELTQLAHFGAPGTELAREWLASCGCRRDT
jgi:hypothetical protein